MKSRFSESRFINIKLGMAFLLFLGISGITSAADGPKKYAFALVQQAAEDYNRKIDSLKEKLELEVGILQTKVVLAEAAIDTLQDAEVDTEGFLKLSKDDVDKLKYLLKQVISYK